MLKWIKDKFKKLWIKLKRKPNPSAETKHEEPRNFTNYDNS